MGVRSLAVFVEPACNGRVKHCSQRSTRWNQKSSRALCDNSV